MELVSYFLLLSAARGDTVDCYGCHSSRLVFVSFGEGNYDAIRKGRGAALML